MLGEGGLARVYLVRHVNLGTVHALKLLTLQHPSLADRLMQEGRIQAQLRHPNIVAVTDIVTHHGQPGLLMEYVDCVPLDNHLHAAGALPLDQALDFFAAILAGMAAAHDAGVLHRDLKPANVLLARTPRGLVPKVSDFGIAKITQGEGGVGRTRSGITMGTPGYMAPEQFDDAASVDVRADIFALGAILYELVTGARAFPSTNMRDVLLASGAAQYVPPERLRPGLPRVISVAIRTALAPAVMERFPDCRAFGRALFGDDPARLAVVEAVSESPRPSLSGRTPSPVGLHPTAPSQPTFEETSHRSSETLAPADPTKPTPVRDRGLPAVIDALLPPDLSTGKIAAIFAALGLFGMAGAASLLYVGFQIRQEESEKRAASAEHAPQTAVPPVPDAIPAPAETAMSAAPSPVQAPPVEAPPVSPASPTPPAKAASAKASAPATTTRAADPAATKATTTAASSSAAATAAATATAAPDSTQAAAPAAVPDLEGAWKSASWTVNIIGQQDAVIWGFAYQTRASERIQVRGAYDPATGKMTVRERGGSRLVIQGTVEGNTITGSTMQGRSEVQTPWVATRSK